MGLRTWGNPLKSSAFGLWGYCETSRFEYVTRLYLMISGGWSRCVLLLLVATSSAFIFLINSLKQEEMLVFQLAQTLIAASLP